MQQIGDTAVTATSLVNVCNILRYAISPNTGKHKTSIADTGNIFSMIRRQLTKSEWEYKSFCDLSLRLWIKLNCPNIMRLYKKKKTQLLPT